MIFTATPPHANAQDVPSVTHSAPLPKWAGAMEQGRRIVRAHLIDKNLPGLSVAVGTGGEIVWAEGFGFADLENRVPVAPGHRLRIGTVSIVLTSAAAGLLVEERRLKLEGAIQTYIPTFPRKQWPVTLRQVMGHLARHQDRQRRRGPLFSAHCERPIEALEHFANVRRRSSPGPSSAIRAMAGSL